MSETLKPDAVCSAFSYNDEPCQREKGHKGPHIYRDGEGMILTWYEPPKPRSRSRSSRLP